MKRDSKMFVFVAAVMAILLFGFIFFWYNVRPRFFKHAEHIASIDSAYVILYENDTFWGSKLEVKYKKNFINLKNASSESGEHGFGDKISSIRWQIPVGYKFIIYRKDGFREPLRVLVGTGRMQYISDLEKEGIGDAISSGKWMFDNPPSITEIKNAYVELYDDHDFSDRQLTITYNGNISDFEKITSDDGGNGFNDKTSSVRWQIPKGYRVVLYSDKDYKSEAMVLNGNGNLQQIRDINIDSLSFGDKISSVRWFNSYDYELINTDGAFVELYDDDDFRDRQLTIKYNQEISNFETINSDEGGSGFGDKASSVRWQIPKGHRFILYNDDGFKNIQFPLEGTGRLQEINNLNKGGLNFGDRASSGRWFTSYVPELVNVKSSFVELYDDTDFRDRRLTVRHDQNISNFDQANSDDGHTGFGDKASSVRWQISVGHKFVLYVNDGFKDNQLILEGTGKLEEYKDLNSRNFSDKISSGRWFTDSPTTTTAIGKAFVELYDDIDFADRKLTIIHGKDISNFENVKSDDGELGFGDKTSSVRWQIPTGYKFVLYSDDGFKNDSLILQGNGQVQEIKNLKSNGFGDKASSGRWMNN